MKDPGSLWIAAVCVLTLVLAACGGEREDVSGAPAPSGPATLDVAFESPLPLLGVKLRITSGDGAAIELILQEAQGRWRGSRGEISPGSYELQALLDEGAGWLPGAGRVSLELPPDVARQLFLFFDRSEGLFDPHAPQLTPRVATISSEEGTLVELSLEVRASEGAANRPLIWSMTVGGTADCAAAAAWNSEGDTDGPSITGVVEDGAAIDASLFLPYVPGMDRCTIVLSLTDDEGARTTAIYEVSTARIPIDLTIEE